jgi:23S rRNA (pseudouridine1915-N3)-methyltransferase
VKLRLLWVGRGKDKWSQTACTHYVDRLPRHLSFSDKRINPVDFAGDVAAVRRREAEKILGELKDGDTLVALDERGQALSSENFAALIDSATKQGTKRLVFAIGGPYGHGPEVRKRAWKTIRLSDMVLNHAIARVVLTEQLYRASTILWGGSYHH